MWWLLPVPPRCLYHYLPYRRVLGISFGYFSGFFFVLFFFISWSWDREHGVWERDSIYLQRFSGEVTIVLQVFFGKS